MTHGHFSLEKTPYCVYPALLVEGEVIAITGPDHINHIPTGASEGS
ncbi:MAG: hypothetical protein KJN60_08850 [Boseongicola sp.]|nr:hypothetical protein [Boseongicola sp.]